MTRNSKSAPRWLLVIILLTISGDVSGHSVSVTTSKGEVEGYTLNDVSVFEGIPYAKPPTGELRFQAPLEPDPWPLPLQTKAFKNICPQMMTAFSAQMNIVGSFSEDCLYLNVYTPVVHGGPARASALLPVMIWIHGGGYIQGSASQTPAPGIVSNLASRNVVIVTFNYRLDILGFFSTDSDDVPDNVALLDQLAAMKWVQKEIRHFGGNPKDVTLFGYSAGASSISAHLYSPLSKGLFSKAILQSGSSFAPWAWSYSDQDSNLRISRETTRKLACSDALKWNKKDFRKIINCMRSVSAEVLIESAWDSATKLGLGWRLVVGGNEGFLPMPPSDLAYERRDSIPIMIGTTSDETVFTAAPSVIMYGEGNVTKSLFSNAIDSLTQVYFKETEWNTVRTILGHVYGDGDYRIDNGNAHAWLDSTVQMQSGFSFFAPAILEAQLLLDTQQTPIFLYSLDYVSDGFPWASPFRGAPHGQDMFYIFSTTAGGLGWTFTKEEQNIVDLFGKMWTNFAKSGNPNFPSQLNFNWTSLKRNDRWSYLSINTPLPRMSETPYHWKADKVYNHLLPRLLSPQKLGKEDTVQFHQSDEPNDRTSSVFELRTNQFFIATWALLVTLVGVVVVILLFSICHWHGPGTGGTTDSLELVGYSPNEAAPNDKGRRKKRKNSLEKRPAHPLITPMQRIPYGVGYYYKDPVFNVRSSPSTYAYDCQSRHMMVPGSTSHPDDSSQISRLTQKSVSTSIK